MTKIVFTLCFITVLQTFCEGPNNGGSSLAKFHEGPDPRTLAGSIPMQKTCHLIHVVCDHDGRLRHTVYTRLKEEVFSLTLYSTSDYLSSLHERYMNAVRGCVCYWWSVCRQSLPRSIIHSSGEPSTSAWSSSSSKGL